MNRAKTLTKLGVFATVCVLAGVGVVNTLTDPITESTDTYHAVFTDAYGLNPGSDVLIAGVRVGKIEHVELEDGQATVSFDLERAQHVPANALAAIRYADLLGARYLAITPGPRPDSNELPVGETIPVQRTHPALDLTTLFNGFKPLFDAIDPGQVNQLASEIVAVFQGESGTITDLLTKIVSLTSTLSSRDEVIGHVLENLNSVLASMNNHREDLRGLMDGLGQLTATAAESRGQISDALTAGSELARSLTGLLGDIQPGLSHDVRSMRQIADTLAGNQEQLSSMLGEAPRFLNTLNKTLDYGSWVNVYVCNLSLGVAGNPIDLGVGPHSQVCR